MTKIGIMLESQENLTWDKLFTLAEVVENVGLDSVYCSDHLTSVKGVAERESMALWPAITALALRTKRIRIGSLMNSIIFRHPVQVAKYVSSVDVLSNGRIDLGIGAGWYEFEHKMFGIDFPKYSERLGRLKEGLEIIKALWSGKPVTYKGQYYNLEEAEMNPLPAQNHVPIIMGGMGPKSLEVVAKHADEWNSYYITKEVFKEKKSILERKCQSIGRDPGTLLCSFMCPYAIGSTDREVKKQIDANRVTFNLPASQSEWVKAGFLCGTPEQVVEQMASWMEAGVGRFILEHNNLEDSSPIALIGDEVLPKVQ
jgi:alkanesulfonate monooxygenase SsuD/methylene tetrahydromethanopterin reductase-like flavin-dependent oxidoreductase (luciferase family)